ncbi:MAG: lantibiotic ABC transporter [Elusimicrobia bacterium RIFOXYB2_FULL_48_7]|nr:MAG: lantibiotic ABC transporter [Elusimicrobia bacterium RIFOXYB2_FULL_48_7]
MYANYYAPRGRNRLYILGSELSQRYIYPTDLLIGIIGAEGSGKSTLIKGLFPGLELTNDDDGINIQPAPIFKFAKNDFFSGHTFHIDIRFESAFKQKYEIVEAINNAIAHNRRVVVEHFELVYEQLGYNAQIIFGIGEEVIVCRPSVFGPFPADIKKIVDKTIKFRLMAHSAEDITSMILAKDYNYTRPVLHSDVRHGFVIGFSEKPNIDIAELEKKVLGIINSGLKIQMADESHINIGEEQIYCTGVRTHVNSSNKIENFRLVKDYKYDPISKEYLLIGIVGKKESAGFEDLSPIIG